MKRMNKFKFYVSAKTDSKKGYVSNFGYIIVSPKRSDNFF